MTRDRSGEELDEAATSRPVYTAPAAGSAGVRVHGSASPRPPAACLEAAAGVLVRHATGELLAAAVPGDRARQDRRALARRLDEVSGWLKRLALEERRAGGPAA